MQKSFWISFGNIFLLLPNNGTACFLVQLKQETAQLEWSDQFYVNRAWTWFYILPFAQTVKSVIDNFPYFSWFLVKNLQIFFVIAKIMGIGCKRDFTI